MPRPVPIGEYTPSVPVEEGMRRIIPEASGASGGPALEEFGGSLQRVATSEAANYTQAALSQAQGQWTQHLQEAQEKAPPGAPNFTPTFMQQYADYAKQAVKGAPNSLASRMLQQHLGEFGSQLQNRALEFEAQARTDHNVDVTKSSVDSAGNELMLDPSVFNQRLAQRLHLLDAMNLDPQTKEKLATYASTEMARYATLGAIQKDPYAAELELHSATPTQAYTSHLTPELKAQLSQEADRTLRERVSDAERLHTMTLEQQKTQQDGILKQALMLSEQPGGLTASWINQHADILDHEQMNFLLEKAKGGKEATGDPRVFSDLLLRAHQGEDVSDDAQTHLFHHDITDAQFSSILSAGEKGLPNWRAEGASYISKALAVSQLNPDPAHSTSLANALMEWTDYERDNPKATPKDAQAAYTDIVRRYQLIDQTQMQLTLPVPHYLVGSRAQPNVEASEQATIAAYKAGKLSRQEFDHEAALLKQWAALNKKPNATPNNKQQ